MKTITLNTLQDYSIVVPADLGSITTYVVMEQERWFEAEIDFVSLSFKPGMNAIDIGANLGVYSLLLAKRGGAESKILAYEPGREARECLQESRANNGFENLEIMPLALSNRAGQFWLTSEGNSELNTLVTSGAREGRGEVVDVTTLDAEYERAQWGSLDFIKIDAEGQEARIIVGARKLLNDQSPLIMYEVVDKAQKNHQLRWMFELLGYSTYRLSGDRKYLLKIDDESSVVGDLNYFAAKPDRAAKLAAAGLLVEDSLPRALLADERAAALAAYLSQPFAVELEISADDFAEPTPYLEALLAYSAYLYLDWPAPRRHAALSFAYQTLSAVCGDCTSLARVSTFVRVMLSSLRRFDAHPALTWLRSECEKSEDAALDEPFFPAAARFDCLSVKDDVRAWFAASVLDALLISSHFSGCFGGIDLQAVKWLAQSDYANLENKRRYCLQELKERGNFGLSIRLIGEGHQNQVCWEKQGERVSGLVKT